MESKDTSAQEKEQEQSKLINSDNMLKNIKSNFILKKFFDYIHKNKIIRNNKI